MVSFKLGRSPKGRLIHLPRRRSHFLAGALISLAISALLAGRALAQTPAPADAPYRVLYTQQFVCPGRFDFILADSDARRLYIPRGDRVMTFDLDTLQQGQPILKTDHSNGLAIDFASHHGFADGKPVVMWDTTTLLPIKSISIPGDPSHGIVCDPLTERIFAFTHPAPIAVPPPPGAPVAGTNASAASPAPPALSVPTATVLNGRDGSIVGTLELGSAAEQAVSDGQGNLYVALKDTDSVAVVDVKTLKVTATYSLGGKGRQPCGLGLDVKNHVLFVFCLLSANAVILDATNGNMLQTLPIGHVVEAGGFNPATMEAFSSQGDGTLTIIKENSPTSFAVEQTVTTYRHGRTCTLDAKTNHIIVVFPEHLDQPAPAGAPAILNLPPPAPSGTLPPGATSTEPPPKRPGFVKFHIYVIGR